MRKMNWSSKSKLFLRKCPNKEPESKNQMIKIINNSV